jgi:hypothetical protein
MKNLIDYAYNDNGTEFRDALYSAIHDKVAAHIDAKKQEIASGLMGQQFEEDYELDEDVESLDEISAEKIVDYSDKAQKAYADPKTSPEKKERHRIGLTTGYQKLKARAKVPAVYGEEVESLEEMENYEAVKATRNAHIAQFTKQTGLPAAHAEQYASAVVKYPNNHRAGAEQAADRIAGPKVKVKFNDTSKENQEKHIGHVQHMAKIMKQLDEAVLHPDQKEVKLYLNKTHELLAAGTKPFKPMRTSAGHIGVGIAYTKNGKTNIMQHKDGNKYFAAGGSSSGVTKHTTFHDTPEAAAQSYHDK